MFFLSYKSKDVIEIGLLSNDNSGIIPLKDIFNLLKRECPKNMIEFISLSNDDLIKEIENLLISEDLCSIDKNDVIICPPITKPNRNIMCIGKNYSDHVNELKGKTLTDSNIPDEPVYFTKSAYSINGNNSVIKNHSNITNQLDYEIELAVIIGKDGINIPKEDALDYIFGYTIANDVTARNIQMDRKQWFKGKSLDTFCPMGPYIVHKDSIPYPVELDLSCKVNGEIRQKSNTRNMIFDISYIINDLSKGMELKAGDIILTGTPSGVGFGFNPPKFLESGDVVECHIDKIGTLVNTVE